MASEVQNLIRLSEYLRSEGFDAWVDNDRNAVGVREPKTGLCIFSLSPGLDVMILCWRPHDRPHEGPKTKQGIPCD